MRKLLIAAALLTLIDHGFRLQWLADCAQSDEITCPAGPWFWSSYND